MKSKFAGLNFDSVEVLTQEEKMKVKGGYSAADGWDKWGPGITTNAPISPSGSGGSIVNGCASNQFVSTDGSNSTVYNSLSDCESANWSCTCKGRNN